MKHSTEIINQSENGRLIYCKTCENFQLDYKVAQFTLTNKQLAYLIECIDNLMNKYKNVDLHQIPKLLIPTLVRKQYLNLTYSELIELNKLVTGEKSTTESLTYKFSIN